MANPPGDRPVVVADTITREVLGRFESYARAAAFAGMSRAGALDQCRKKSAPLKGGLYVRFEDEFEPGERFGPKVRVPIYVTDGRRLRMFHGPDEAAEILNRSKITINSYLASGSGLGLEWGRFREGKDALIRNLEERCQSKS